MTKPSFQVDYPSVKGAEHPWPVFDHLRHEAPVYQIPDRPNLFIVSRYEDVRNAFGNTELFSSFDSRDGLNGYDLLLGTQSLGGIMMSQTDPPHHKQKRDLGFAPLKPGRLKTFEPMIVQIVDRLIDSFISRGRCEFVTEFAHELPTLLTTWLLGVPESDIAWVRLWAQFEASGLSWMPEEFQTEQRANGRRMFEYLTQLIQKRHDELRQDVISDMIRAQLERDDAFDLSEVRAQAVVLLGGGIVTTAHFLSSMMNLLLENPHEMRRVRDDHGLIPKMIEEGLRLEPPTVWTPRRVTRNTELAGVAIPAGSFVLLMQAAANRDENRFECPADFDVRRKNAHDHLSFGYGPHFCLGAPLARLEIRIAFDRLLTRLRNIRPAKDNNFAHIESPSFRGLKLLNLEFEPATE